MTKDDIELLPLPPLHIAPSVEPADYPEVAQALMDYARAAIEPYKQRIAEFEAELEAIGAGGVSAQPITSQRGEPGVAVLVEALTELCDEIDKHHIHAAISETSISWFKRKARKALAAAMEQQV